MAMCTPLKVNTSDVLDPCIENVSFLLLLTFSGQSVSVCVLLICQSLAKHVVLI